MPPIGVRQHDGMSTPADDGLRTATGADAEQLVELWTLVFAEEGADPRAAWRKHALDWFARTVEDALGARFPVVEVDGSIVATAIGTLETGVPNPHSPRGRTVRLANVITLPSHRGRGHGTRVVRDVVDWARSIEADRVDLSATPDAQRIYERAGFTLTTAPRMKLVL